LYSQRKATMTRSPGRAGLSLATGPGSRTQQGTP
jgi:hypothetical protein